jgi:predicted nuclease of predicted toxin-antitoxin system
LKVKFLVDECTGKRLSNLLNAAGYDTVFVGDWRPSAPDDEVLDKAN